MKVQLVWNTILALDKLALADKSQGESYLTYGHKMLGLHFQSGGGTSAAILAGSLITEVHSDLGRGLCIVGLQVSKIRFGLFMPLLLSMLLDMVVSFSLLSVPTQTSAINLHQN